MKRLRIDIQTHRQASLWFFSCWLVSTAIAITVFPDSPVMAVIVLSPPLVAGALVGWWRASAQTHFLPTLLGGRLQPQQPYEQI
jgi:hypothetical protein